MKVELQYFDGCPSWHEAEERLREALDAAGRVDVVVERVLVSTPEQAAELSFHGSPSVLVDGVDPFAAPDAPVGLACRLYRTPSGLAGAPTVEQLADVLAAR
ncbi:thioredoxin family protein (plasmid) [Cellulomonas sp. WB94]|uniref:DF family (seleno)protein n=1 Tax=Cellulomonas sp. WB94 TaxID=2173174 RepID=UPI000D57D0C5|nr:thioredoxin family protein [Cellulomonas sp. WB94]PVU84310.1 thioredoxin family protein [Cellulomonas sp. WB94]